MENWKVNENPFIFVQQIQGYIYPPECLKYVFFI